MKDLIMLVSLCVLIALCHGCTTIPNIRNCDDKSPAYNACMKAPYQSDFAGGANRQ